MIKITNTKPIDDFRAIIKLIYDTDPFIYPAMCDGDYAFFEDFMTTFLMQECLFSYKNILLAKEEGNIIGLILTFGRGDTLIVPSFDTAKPCLLNTITDYFKPLLEKIEPNALCVNNLCVSENFRHKGAGYKLLQHLQNNTKYDKITLACLANNQPAVALYKKCGFEVTKTFPGFTGNGEESVQCYEFVWVRK